METTSDRMVYFTSTFFHEDGSVCPSLTFTSTLYISLYQSCCWNIDREHGCWIWLLRSAVGWLSIEVSTSRSCVAGRRESSTNNYSPREYIGDQPVPSYEYLSTRVANNQVGLKGLGLYWLITYIGLATTHTGLTLPLLGKRVKSEGRLNWLLATLPPTAASFQQISIRCSTIEPRGSKLTKIAIFCNKTTLTYPTGERRTRASAALLLRPHQKYNYFATSPYNTVLHSAKKCLNLI